MPINTKHGSTQLLAKHIVFTSNEHPNTWYPNVLANPKRKKSFDRRIHNIIRFDDDGYVIERGRLPWAPMVWMVPKPPINPFDGSTERSEEDPLRNIQDLLRERNQRLADLQ